MLGDFHSLENGYRNGASYSSSTLDRLIQLSCSVRKLEAILKCHHCFIKGLHPALHARPFHIRKDTIIDTQSTYSVLERSLSTSD